jgi:GNAT superfamily N-acetyltransferase
VRVNPPRRIASSDRLTEFDCGKAPLNEWLARHALKAERERTARTYVACARQAPLVVGYYSLAVCSVVRSSIGGGRLARNSPDLAPGVLLARLAVDLRSQGLGLGTSLLADAVNKAEAVSERAGARALIVEALDDEAATFYLAKGFIPFPADPARLFHRI